MSRSRKQLSPSAASTFGDSGNTDRKRVPSPPTSKTALASKVMLRCGYPNERSGAYPIPFADYLENTWTFSFYYAVDQAGKEAPLIACLKLVFPFHRDGLRKGSGNK
jgi:hypothetical protein